MPVLLRRRQQLAVQSLQIVLLVLLAGYAVRCLTPLRGTGPSWLEEIHIYALSGGSALLVVLRALWVRTDRWALSFLAAGMVAYALGYLYYFRVALLLDPVPYPSLADAAWLAYYPMAYAGVLLLLRRRIVRFHASMWLDGLLAGLGVTAFAAAFVLPVLHTDTGAGFALVATNLSYPVADLLIMALVLGVFALFGWRPGRVWWLMAAGLVCFVAADTGYLFATAAGTYAAGGPINLCWQVGLVLLALAAWQPMHDRVRVQVEGWVVLVVPSLFSLLSLGMLMYAGARPLPGAAIGLAGASVVVALARTGLTFREVRSLADARLQARTDDLTGLPNRRSFLELAQAALERRTPSGRLVMLLVDLDRFKSINDSFGHEIGDVLLQQIGPRLRSVVRPTDVIARLGGDEFGIVLVDADEAYASDIASRLHDQLRRPFELDGIDVTLDASIGIALCPQHGDGTNVLLQRADIAMYQAKDARSGCEVYLQDGDNRILRRLETLEQLRTGIEQDQLVLHYQPKIDLATGQVAGVEALVRWHHPTRGLVYPDSFLPVAEQGGLMRLLTLSVLEKSVRQLADWRHAGITMSVAVNLSVSNLQDAALPAQVQLLLETLDVPAENLVLEITENILMADPHRALHVLAQLRSLGLRLSVDDYGTGYSSLAYLRQLPVDELKLDRTFVTHMDTDPRSAAIVRSTIALAHSLDMVMVAEGVEGPAALGALADAGCDLAQGYHICPPQPADKITAWLSEHVQATTAGRVEPAPPAPAPAPAG